MAYCGNCGNALTEEQRFCPACGHPVGAGAAGHEAPAPPPGVPAAAPPEVPPPPAQYAQPAPPPVPPAAYGGEPGYQPGYQPGWYPPGQQAPPAQRSRRGLWIGGIGAALVVVIAVVCVLVFVVFRGDSYEAGPSGSPEQTVRKLISAYEDKNVNALFKLIDPDQIPALLNGQTEDAVKEALKDAAFGGGSVKFSGIKLSTKKTSETTATVTIVAGKVTLTDENGQKTTSDVKEASEPPTVDLVAKYGKWYIDAQSMSLLSGEGTGSDTTPTTD